MNKRGILRSRIRTRLIGLFLGLSSALMLTKSYLSFDSIVRAGQRAQQAGTAVPCTQAQDYLLRLTTNIAERDNQRLEQVRQDAKTVAQYAANLFEQPEAFANARYRRAQDHMFVGQAGPYINGPHGISLSRRDEPKAGRIRTI
jgi:hypothetical protein